MEGQIRHICFSLLNPKGCSTSVWKPLSCSLQSNTDKSSDKMSALSSTVASYFFSSVRFCWQDTKTATLSSFVSYKLSICSSLVLSLLLQQPYVKPSWSLFRFFQNKTKSCRTIQEAQSVAHVGCELFLTALFVLFIFIYIIYVACRCRWIIFN